ncbi:bifunctional folylpolyglutamate synthase/dihydrofolate synthase [Tengunoibacter tsumagoiensis]|uniref:tetrahydrofolate synthase n=1 Tax=Tengunoibacter tsumagoiensis TaxID=2014871 RepID=A0A402A3B1_9CHLR|nr:Mur ligase family protein [Tengunoibacter tsumagoiensis]GCE13529.1 hypothetical protein KTT_33880 [Tengunoibacter tsumagoiensis]
MHQSQLPTFIQELVYGSYLKVADRLHGPDALTRDLSFAQDLFTALAIDWRRWPRVTITGSKGKGSTSALLASILQASGERVGLVSSPEMRSFNERIRIDGRCVSFELLEEVAQEIFPAVHSITSQIEPPNYLGPGGVILALAAKIFARSNVSALVVEAGRGGEYDEARLLQAPVSILTPIMLEHQDKLGATVQEIARTKAYISAPGSSIIMSPQTESVQSVVREVATQVGATILAVNKDIWVEEAQSNPDGVVCTIRSDERSYRDLHIPLAGLHQAENAATALLAAKTLQQAGANYTEEGVYEGLSRVRWPGRAQVLQQSPWVLVDGAINRESAQQICELVRHYPAKRITAVISVPKPKDLAGVCEEIARIADRIILTELPVPTLTWYEDAVHIASLSSPDVHSIIPAENAFRFVMDEVQADEGILLLGTQSFVGSALDFWNIDTCTLWK